MIKQKVNKMKNQKIVKKVVDGVDFTFRCVRSAYTNGYGQVSYQRKWYWGADIFNGTGGGVSIGKGHSSITEGIKHQVRAAKMQEIINAR